MYFIAILITFALLQHWGSFSALQRDGWFFGIETFSRSLSEHQWFGYVSSVMLPVCLLIMMLVLCEDRLYGMASLFFAVATLVYALGRVDYNAAMENYIALWRSGEYEKMPDVLQQLGNASAGFGEGMEKTHVLVRDTFIQAAFQGVFVVLFWFVLLGPAAALFYRLNTLYPARADWFPARRIQTLLEWPAAFLASLTFVFMGNYEKCMPVWLSTVFSRSMESRHVVHANALAAVGLGMDWLTVRFSEKHDINDQKAMAVTEATVLMQLIRRSLVFLVFVVALFQIVI